MEGSLAKHGIVKAVASPREVLSSKQGSAPTRVSGLCVMGTAYASTSKWSLEWSTLEPVLQAEGERVRHKYEVLLCELVAVCHH